MKKSLVIRGRALALLAASLVATPALAQNTSGVPVPAEPKFDTGDPVARGRQIADYLDDFNSGWVDQYAKSTMTLYDARGDQVTREVRQMIKEGEQGDKAVSRFMSPPDIRGVAALIHEHHARTDDSWLYLPASRRVRRISGANRTASFQGTEFTYEDLSAIVPSRYRWKYLDTQSLTVDGDTHEVHRLQAEPTYDDTGYQKLIVYVNPKAWRTEKVEYFDLAGRKLKTLTFTAWKRFHGRFWRAHVLDMQNHQTKKRTTLRQEALFVNMSLYKRRDGSPRDGLADAQFTRAALEKY